MARLIDLSAEQMLDELEKRQDEAIEAEAREARAKGALSAVEGACIDQLRRNGNSIEVSKKLVWDREELRNAHSVYLEVWIEFQKAKAAEKRAVAAIDLWRTQNANARRA